MRDVLQPVEEEDHAEQEQDVVVAGHHVLGAEIDERQQMDAGDLLDVALVALGDGVRQARPLARKSAGSRLPTRSASRGGRT